MSNDPVSLEKFALALVNADAKIIPHALLRSDTRNLFLLYQRIHCHNKMNGINLRLNYSYPICNPTLDLNFKLQRPEIELCDIIEFLQKVNKMRKKNKQKYKHCIYLNLCENSKFYVGISTTDVSNNSVERYKNGMLKRLEMHRDNGGGSVPTNWTWIHKVISNIVYMKGNHTDENLVTQLVAKCVGPENVRGGDWTEIHSTPKFPEMTVKQILDAIEKNS
jgi:hypothetical protein